MESREERYQKEKQRIKGELTEGFYSPSTGGSDILGGGSSQFGKGERGHKD